MMNWNEAGICSTAKAKTVWSYTPLPIYTILASHLSKGMGDARILSREQPENLFTNLHLNHLRLFLLIILVC
jgi:hypothetical protein